MSTTICTEDANELILVEDVIDPAGRPVVALGLVNQDGSDTFPGRTLIPEQAEGLSVSLALAAAAARARAGSAPSPLAGEQAYLQTLGAIRAAVPLTGTSPAPAEAADERADATASRSAAPARSGRARGLEDLPIADYHELGASVIIKQLAGLSAVQLTAVLAYEQSHRNRKRICNRIAALQSSLSRAAGPSA
jgi:hypothetical protein